MARRQVKATFKHDCREIDPNLPHVFEADNSYTFPDEPVESLGGKTLEQYFSDNGWLAGGGDLTEGSGEVNPDDSEIGLS